MARICSTAENGRNRGRQANNTSGYKGVTWRKDDNCWQAQIQINGKKIYLGRFDNPELAAEAYRQAAKKYHGEFARF